MVGCSKIGRITNSAAKFDRLEWVCVIKGDKFSDEIRALRLQPKMKFEIPGIEGATSVH